MWDINIGGAFVVVAIIALCIGLGIWGLWELVDWIWIDDSIKCLQPIEPTIELFINENNQVDTLYVYQPCR